MPVNAKEKQTSLYEFESRPPVRKALPIALQHIMAMFLGTVTVPIVVASASGASAAMQTTMVQYSLILSALATLIQVYALGPVGARLPIIFCAGFTCVPVFTSIGAQFGLAGVFGGQLLCAAITLILGFFVGKIHKFFPTVVTGTIILSIGLSLYPIALKYMAGNASSATYGALNNWVVAFITLAAVLLFNLLGRGVLKMASILLGAAVGYLVALALGMVQFDGVQSAAWLAVPTPFFYGAPTFDVSMVLPVLLITVVNVMQAVGDITGTTVGGFDREPTGRELSGGVLGAGGATLLGAVFGVPVVSSYSQNVGIVSMNKVVSRRVVGLAAAIMLALGIVPKFSALVSTLPAPVIGGSTLIVFGMITITGLKLVTSEPLTARNSTIVGVSIALAMGLSTLEGTQGLAGFPPLAQTLLTKPVVVAGVLSFVLNLITPNKTMEQEARERAELDEK